MQIKFLPLLLIALSFNSFAYECHVKELKRVNVKNKKKAYQIFRELNRQAIVDGLLFEITSAKFNKTNIGKSKMLLGYLENSEINTNQRSFFKLLAVSSDITTSTPKSLKLEEVCEIMDKVNKLDGK